MWGEGRPVKTAAPRCSETVEKATFSGNQTCMSDPDRKPDFDLAETVADLEVEPEAPSSEAASSDEPPAMHSRPPPPVPVFGHSRPSDEAIPLSRSLVDDAPPRPPSNAPSQSEFTPPPTQTHTPSPPVHFERVGDRRWRPDFGSASPSNVPDLEREKFDSIFDRPEALIVGSTAQYDPEAGRSNVSVRIQAVRHVVRAATVTPFGRLVIVIPLALAAIALTIISITMQETWMIIAAFITAPIAAFLVYRRYQAWLGHRRYMYRLLETLGEDVSDFDPSRANRAIRRRLSQ